MSAISESTVEDEVEAIEIYIILLLGARKRPIPSILHLEKEMFILSNFNPKLKRFIHFIKHYKGPYSHELAEILKEPQYYRNAWTIRYGRIYLTNEGRKIYESLLRKIKDNKKFQKLLSAIKLLRDIYDRLTNDELLLLIYTRYEEYTEKSEESERILKEDYKKKLAKRLLAKGIITEERYKEIVGEEVEN